MRNIHLIVVAITLLCCNYAAQADTPLWQGKGRIAISSDGNHHDHDDWAATALTLGLLASQGLQDRVTLYVFSDHIWGSSRKRRKAAEQMRISALEGKTQFGFDNTRFIEGVAEPEAAVAAMTAQIDKSTAADPLFIVAAGPMEVVGRAIAKAKPKALAHTFVLSHSKWNNRHSDKPGDNEDHSGWTLTEIDSEFTPKGLNIVKIKNQNGGKGYDGLRAVRSKFDWVKTSPARQHKAYKPGSWDWLYTRLESCIKKNGTEFDPSDAGMIIYLLTGKQATEPSDARDLMENPLVRN